MAKVKKALIAAVMCSLLPMGAATYAAETGETKTEQNAVDTAEYPSLEETLAKLQGRASADQETQNAQNPKNEETSRLSRREKNQVETLKGEFYAMSETQAEILSLLDRLNERLDGIEVQAARQKLIVPGPTTANLVNPSPASRVNYTQDAINAQGSSTMVFAYAPNQLYKIYCRRGFVTDLAFKKGEAITYIGGGDTSGWAVSQTTVDGTAHLFIKPTVETSTTNMIVATSRRSYHILLNSSDWYNPMVMWNYADEPEQEGFLAAKQAEKPATVAVTDIEALDHAFKVSGRNQEYMPAVVYSDGKRTYLEFEKLPKKQVPLFVQQKGERTMTIMNYRQKGNLYIVDGTFQKAQLRVSENESVTIAHK